jgi:hypothetical protein
MSRNKTGVFCDVTVSQSVTADLTIQRHIPGDSSRPPTNLNINMPRPPLPNLASWAFGSRFWPQATRWCLQCSLHSNSHPRYTCSLPLSTSSNSACHNSGLYQLQMWRSEEKEQSSTSVGRDDPRAFRDLWWTGTGFSVRAGVSTSQYHSTHVTYSFIHLSCSCTA